MRRAAPVLAVCAALVFTAGCGSSKSSATTSTTTKTGTAAGAGGGLVANGKIDYAKPPASAPTLSGLIQVTYREISIEPDAIKAKVGSTVKWTNQDPQPCNVTSEGGPYKIASKDFGEGATFELKLDKPGTIHYECTHYPTTMNGTIEVVE
jgi:plastocyanin